MLKAWDWTGESREVEPMNNSVERIKNGIITENPTFVQILGMCPTLAVTTSAINGLGMGLSTTVILIMSNLMISALRNVIPNRVRIPAYIVIVASFVTIIDFLLQAFLPGLSESLGGYIKLIVVNCIILGRAESYASKNPVVPSIFDGVGMGLGFTIGLTAIGLVRELLGAGSVFGMTIPGYQPVGIFVLSPGAFIVLAFLIAFLNYRKQKKQWPDASDTVCRGEDCMHCGNTSCGGKFFDFDGGTDVVGRAGQTSVSGQKQNKVQKTEIHPVKQKETEPPAEQEEITQGETQLAGQEEITQGEAQPAGQEEIMQTEAPRTEQKEEKQGEAQPAEQKEEKQAEAKSAEQKENKKEKNASVQDSRETASEPEKKTAPKNGKKRKKGKKHPSKPEQGDGRMEAAAADEPGKEDKTADSSKEESGGNPVDNHKEPAEMKEKEQEVQADE